MSSVQRRDASFMEDMPPSIAFSFRTKGAISNCSDGAACTATTQRVPNMKVSFALEFQALLDGALPKRFLHVLACIVSMVSLLAGHARITSLRVGLVFLNPAALD